MLVTGACSSSDESGSTVTTSTGGTTLPPGGGEVLLPADRVPLTAWEEVQEQITDPMPLQTAIDAFSVAFGPIEGATPTELSPGFSGSGTGPLRWILGHRDELTEQQRASVDRILAEWEAGATAAPAEPVLLAAASPFAASALAGPTPQALVDDVVVSLETLLGRSLTVPIVVKVAASGAAVEGNRAVTIARNSSGGYTGEMASCTILYNPDSLSLTGAEAVALAAHEAFHCFETDLAGSLEQSHARPAWIVEGMAEWAGEAVSGGSQLSTETWGTWLKWGEVGLFERSYTAIGFYAHVDDSGVELWDRLDAAILASDTSSQGAYEVLIDGGSSDLVDSWAPGYFRDPAHAPVWDQNGPGITLDAPDIPEANLQAETSYSLHAAPYAVFYGDIDVQASAEVVTFESPGEGLAMFSDGTTMELEDLHGLALCTTGGCACPEGSARAGTQFTPVPLGVMQVGPTGHVFGSAVTVVGWSLERFCDQERCHVGSWETGVWHVPRVIGGGINIPLAITAAGEGYVDWSQATDILGVVQGGTFAGPEILPVRFVLDGASHFFVEVVDSVMRVTAAAGSMSITPYIDFGDGWIQTGDGSVFTGYGQVGEATFECAGNTMILNGAIEFWRVSNDAAIPPQFADITPTSSPGGGSNTTAGPLPDVDPCELLTLTEVQQLVPEATAPQGADDLPTEFFTQCSFGLALAIQVYGPGGPETFTDAAELLGATNVEISGIGDWAIAQVNVPEPEFGAEDYVLLVAAGNQRGRVAIVPLVSVFPDTPEYQTLLSLLELALGRL